MVPFAKSCLKFNFSGEQFWGRAARAPRSRKRFEALVIWGRDFQMDAPSSLRSQVLGLRFLPNTPDLTPNTCDPRPSPQLVEIVKLTVILASVSTGSVPSR